jgi:hypothetical protein
MPPPSKRPSLPPEPGGAVVVPGPGWSPLAGALVLLAALLAYAPDAGHGLVKDDFHWIRSSAVERLADVPSLLDRHTGFYRPVVALSFAANYAAVGLDPRWYGWANLGLALLAAGLIAAWARTLGLQRGAALLAAGLWLLNVHGIDMAILWGSGRTALLLTCFGVGSAMAASRGRLIPMSGLLLLALLSKEEAVLLPIALLVILATSRDDTARPGRRARWLPVSVALAVPLGIYFALRAHAGAMTPATAPPFYRFSFEPLGVLRNVLEYAGRAGGMATLAVAVAAVAAGLRWPALGTVRRRAVVVGLAWLACGFGLTVWLPVRSSLYAVFPSVGAVLAGAALAEAWWERTGPRGRTATVVLALALALLLVPVHRRRNARWVRAGRFSTQVVAELSRWAGAVPANGLVVIHDDRSRRTNIASTFGTLVEDAAVLAMGKPVRVWVEPPLPDAALAGMVRPTDAPAAVFRVEDGALRRAFTSGT